MGIIIARCGPALAQLPPHPIDHGGSRAPLDPQLDPMLGPQSLKWAPVRSLGGSGRLVNGGSGQHRAMTNAIFSCGEHNQFQAMEFFPEDEMPYATCNKGSRHKNHRAFARLQD
jgi:hypothetical protein